MPRRPPPRVRVDTCGSFPNAWVCMTNLLGCTDRTPLPPSAGEVAERSYASEGHTAHRSHWVRRFAAQAREGRERCTQTPTRATLARMCPIPADLFAIGLDPDDPHGYGAIARAAAALA